MIRKSTATYKGIQIVNYCVMGYIYCLSEEKDDDLINHYIGMTTKLSEERIDEHKLELDLKIHHNKKLQELYNKNVEFTIIIIEAVIASNYRDLVILLRYKEKQYIKKYKPTCNIVHNRPIKEKQKDNTVQKIRILHTAQQLEEIIRKEKLTKI